MRFLDTFSGIGSASLAWLPLGWTCLAHAEIAAFPSAVLKHRFPDVENLGDCRGHAEWPDYGPVDLVCGGTPCQTFSVAGLRAGLADPRGLLTLTFLAIVDQYRPRWIVWENTPGVLSHDGGRSFAAILGAMGQLGYGWAYRVLDAQYVRVDGFPYAVPQRRRRVFVVGYLGDWRYPAAVLFERQSLQGHHPPRRQTGQGASSDVVASLTASGRGVDRPGESRGQDPVVALPDISNALAARDAKQPRAEDNVGIIAVEVAPTVCSGGNRTGGDRPYGTDGDTVGSLVATMSSGQTNAEVRDDGLIGSLTALHEAPVVAHTLRDEGFDASEDGTGRGTPVIAIHADAAGRSGEALTPSADAEGRVRLRPPGKGMAEDGSMFSLTSSSQAHAVAIQERATAENPENGPDGKGWRDDGAAYTMESRQVPQAVAFDTTQITNPDNRSQPKNGDPCHTIPSKGHPPALAFQPRFARNGRGAPDEVAAALTSEPGRTGKGDSAQCIAMPAIAATIQANEGKTYTNEGSMFQLRNVVPAQWAVRRLMPVECERLMGIPDNFTDIPWRGKEHAPDGPRYKAIGNGWAINQARWIGLRIEMVEALAKAKAAR